MTIARQFIKKIQEAIAKDNTGLPKEYWERLSTQSDSFTFENALELYHQYYKTLHAHPQRDQMRDQMTTIFWDAIKSLGGTPIIEPSVHNTCNVYFLFPKSKIAKSEAKDAKDDAIKNLYLQGDFHGHNSIREQEQRLLEFYDTGIMWRQDTMPKDSIVMYQYVLTEPQEGVLPQIERAPFFTDAGDILHNTSPGKSAAISYTPCDDEYSNHNHLYHFKSLDRIFRVSTDSAYLPGDQVDWIKMLSTRPDDRRSFTFHVALYSDRNDVLHAPDSRTAPVTATYHDDLYYADQKENSPYAQYTRAILVFRPTTKQINNIIVVNDGIPYLITGVLAHFEKMVREDKLSPNTAIVFINPLPNLKQTLSTNQIELYNANPDVGNPGMGVRFIDYQYRIEEYASFMENKLFPELRKRMIHVPEDPKHRFLVGSSLSGTASIYIGLTRPKLFGGVLAQSPSPANRVILVKPLQKKCSAVRSQKNILLSCGEFECPARAVANDNLGYATELHTRFGLPLQTGPHGHAFVAWGEELERSLPAIIEASRPKTWYERERSDELLETRSMLLKFWREKITNQVLDLKAVERFCEFLKNELFKDNAVGRNEIDDLFKKAIDGDISFSRFCDALQKYPLSYIYVMNYAEKLSPGKEIHGFDDTVPHRLQRRDIHNMRQYMLHKKISASISLRDSAEGELVTPVFPENKSSCSFAMHSVGKVFTGMLVLEMVRQNVILEKELTEPLCKDHKDFIDSLPVPDQIKNHLIKNKVTLHQLMTHTSGLGDYLENYENAIKKAVEEKEQPPTIKGPADFLKYADATTSKVGEYRYSNLGILLAGLMVEHAYQLRCGPVTYDDILNKHIIRDAGMESFSPWRPRDGVTNPDDFVSQFIVGSPAGGYWTTSRDLGKFGEWIYERCCDPIFKELVLKYGQEFYNTELDLINHMGMIRSSSACLTVGLKTGAVIAVLSDQPEMAIALDAQIRKNIFAAKDPIQDQTSEHKAELQKSGDHANRTVSRKSF